MTDLNIQTLISQHEEKYPLDFMPNRAGSFKNPHIPKKAIRIGF